MLEATKKRHTDKMREVRYLGPAEKIEKLAHAAKMLGLIEITDTMPWRELFPEFVGDSPQHIALRGARKKEGLTQAELSRLTGIPQGHISAMENGKRAIGREIAKKLGEALTISYKVFL
ncbi:MAG: helix-turn-helix transcriptional regulator [Desulfobacterales bacterium]